MSNVKSVNNACLPLLVWQRRHWPLPRNRAKPRCSCLLSLAAPPKVKSCLDVNAFTFRFEDHFDLAEKLARLLDDDDLRRSMGRNSRNMHTYMQSVEEKLCKYEMLLNAAWHRDKKPGRP